ncbi:MAG TPA: porin [Acidocella sp.]|nr:porin [Acidocella sp.]
MRKLLLASAASLLAAGTAFAQPAKQVAAPGTIVVHLDGYFQFSVGAVGSSQMSGGSVAAGTAYKLNGDGTAGDFRLYPGFDAQTLNGIWYGFQSDIRVTFSNAGEATNSNTTNGQGNSTFYIKRAYGYIGTPDYGFARFGQTDSAFTLLQAGMVQNYGDGSQFNSDGDTRQMLPTIPGLFVYANTSKLYGTNKVVYETPAVAVLGGKLSGAIGFEPNSNAIKQGYANPASANAANAISIVNGSPNRRRNTIDAAVAYAETVNGFTNKVSVSYLHGAPLGILGAAPATAKYGYDELSVFQAGAQTTYAGLTVGANLKEGQLEDGYAFKPKGGRDGLGYIVGASYTVGPYTVGASYFNEQTSGYYVPGSTTVARTLSEYGVAAGANYQIAKPINLFIQYLYGHQHQPGAFAASNGVIGANGNTQEQLVAAGTTLKW